ncbi:MAG: transketolase [Tissierellia bacterium]|nr:transketolase [Tissierellia bacterium]
MNIEQKIINSIRVVSADAIQKANSGHPGLPMGAAPMAYTLWSRHLNVNPDDVNWINRDRFVLSAGHGSMLLYSLLHLYGFKVSMEDIKNFRQLNSNTPGHPEYGMTDGVETSTGPLGQGVGMAVGLAMAEKHLAAKFNKEDAKIVDHYTYVLCGDGDLMEGISSEASSLAGTLGLSKLIMLYDSNSITIEGSTDLAFTEDVAKRYEAYGWQVLKVEDGNDILAIDNAIKEAKAEQKKPTIIIITTKIGYGSPNKVGKASAHGAPLGEDEIEKMREFLQWDYKPFEIPEEIYDETKRQLDKKLEIYNNYQTDLKAYKEKYPKDFKDFEIAISGKSDEDIFDDEYFSFEKDMASRAASGILLNRIANKLPTMFGGSADLAPSNKTFMENSDSFSNENPLGKNIHFGVREHGMAAIANGILLHGGLRSYCATFLVFSDYMKGAMRLSALMEIPQIYILTHDSIGVGEDGPTHQPIDQLAMLRSIPNMKVFRPADFTETAYAWKYAMESEKSPVSIALTRQNLEALENSGEGVMNGAYIVSEAKNELKMILIATGSEVATAINAKEKSEFKDNIRVVSMPSMELFEEQTDEYKEKILPKNIEKRISVEALSTFGWGNYTGIKGINIGMNSFGKSAPANQVFEDFKINEEGILQAIKELFKS